MMESNKAPAISVLMPAYNVEKYIEECILSVMKQTLREIQIICVNDGTQDCSMEIVYKLAAEDDRIVILEKENGGLSSARNLGIDRAEGEYIYFLDSDDWIQPQSIEELYEKASNNMLDIIYFGASTVYEGLEVKRKFQRRFEGYYHRNGEYPKVLHGTEMLQALERNSEYRMSACLQFLRADFLKSNNIRFYEGILHEDNLFSLQCILSAERTMTVNQDYYVRRVRNESIMTDDKSVKSSWGFYACIEKMLSFLEKKEYDEKTVQSIGNILAVIQRDAIYQIRNMSQEEIDMGLPVTANPYQRMNYWLVVRNMSSLSLQNRGIYRVLQRAKDFIKR